MAYRMFSYHPTFAAEFAPGRSNGVPAWDGLPPALRAVIMSRQFGGKFSTQGDTLVRYVFPGDTEKA